MENCLTYTDRDGKKSLFKFRDNEIINDVAEQGSYVLINTNLAVYRLDGL